MESKLTEGSIKMEAFGAQGIVKAQKGVPRNTIVKVAVKLEITPGATGGSTKGGTQYFPQLLELDQKRPLAAVIQDLCDGWHLTSPDQYAVQWADVDHAHYLHYVTERNRNEVKDGNVLRLTSSAAKMAADLLTRLKAASVAQEVKDTLHQLSRLSSDNTFATEFIKKRGLHHLIAMVETGAPTGEPLAALLTSFVELMDHGHVSWDVLEEAFVQQIATNVSAICRTPASLTPQPGGSKTPNFSASQKSDPKNTILVNSLVILEGVIANGTDRVRVVEKCVPLDDVLYHIEISVREDVQAAALALLNAFFLKSTKSQAAPSAPVSPPPRTSQPLSLPPANGPNNPFDPVMLHSIRNVVFDKILKHSKGKHLKPDLLHQLYILEVCMLNTLGSRLQSPMHKDDDCERAKIVELRQTAFEHLDMDGTATVAARGSKASAASAAAVGNAGGPPVKDWARRLGFSNTSYPWEDFEQCPPGLLALDNMIYLARNHTDDYKRLVLENSRFDANEHDCPVVRGCIALTKQICDVLKVGQPPVEMEQAQSFHPLFFSHDEAFHEFFCLCMRLLNKTWKEMRATVNDFNKVLAVVREQILRALERQPETIDYCKKELDQLAYNRIMELRHKEIVERDVQEFQATPIQELRKTLEVGMAELVRQQRLNSLLEGLWFNKNTKRTARDKYRFCRLSYDKKFLQYGDFSEQQNGAPPLEQLLHKTAVVDIKTILTGKDCPFLARQGQRQRTLATYAFSLQLESEPSEPDFLDFIAPDEKGFDVWTDGVHALLGLPMTSQTAQADLNMLLDMEIKIQMLDAEGISIPDTPPPIPDDPPDYDFIPINGLD